MRLICPNCGAQYEVDDEVIPDAGRDVQCSNCGHTWFQRPAHLDRELAEEQGHTIRAEEEPHGAEDLAAAEPEAPAGEAPAEPAAGREPRGLDPAVAGVLREEAEHEAKARRADSGGVETQGDLGLEPETPEERAARRKAAARERMAAMRGPEAEAGEEEGAPGSDGPRSRVLPDIDEINSTLRASDAPERATEEAPAATTPELPEKRGRRGFRIGFSLTVLAASIAALVYILAPEIVRAVPQTEPWITAYVDWVNGARAQVNAALSSGIDSIQALIGGTTGEEGGN